MAPPIKTESLDNLIRKKLPVFVQTTRSEQGAILQVLVTDTATGNVIQHPGVMMNQVPVRFDEVFGYDNLRRATDLRTHIAKGNLVVLDPDYAESIMGTPRVKAILTAQRELARDKSNGAFNYRIGEDSGAPLDDATTKNLQTFKADDKTAIRLDALFTQLISGAVQEKKAVNQLVVMDLDPKSLARVLSWSNEHGKALVASWAEDAMASDAGSSVEDEDSRPIISGHRNRETPATQRPRKVRAPEIAVEEIIEPAPYVKAPKPAKTVTSGVRKTTAAQTPPDVTEAPVKRGPGRPPKSVAVQPATPAKKPKK